MPAALTLHWTDGFLLKPFASPTYVFNYNFSQLKGSSDDGNATLKLVFEDARGSKEVVEEVILLSSTIHFSDTFRFGLNTQIIDKPILLQEVICPKLQELLFFMHSFLTAKVASVDPAFMSVKSGYSTTNTVGQPSSLTRNSSSDAPNYES